MTKTKSNLSKGCIKQKGCIEMQPKIKNATLQPNATRIENCVCSHLKLIRTFSYLEKRSDYLSYFSFLTLIARNTTNDGNHYKPFTS